MYMVGLASSTICVSKACEENDCENKCSLSILYDLPILHGLPSGREQKFKINAIIHHLFLMMSNPNDLPKKNWSMNKEYLIA